MSIMFVSQTCVNTKIASLILNLVWRKMAQKSLELLEFLMSGYILDPDELDDLLMEKTPEDLFLDYKDGKILKEKRKAAQTLREYMSGFANSQGGTLIIGVDQNTWSVTGCVAPGAVILILTNLYRIPDQVEVD